MSTANKISETAGISLMAIFMIAHTASVPLAFIFGDKVDIAISLFVPFYGVFVALF